MNEPHDLDDQLARFFGNGAVIRRVGLRVRARMIVRTLIHPLGIHDPVASFRWDSRLQRLIDEGRVCRVCDRDLY